MKVLACISVNQKGLNKIISRSKAMREHNLRILMLELGVSVVDENDVKFILNDMVVDEVYKGIYVVTLPDKIFNKIDDSLYDKIKTTLMQVELKRLADEIIFTTAFEQQVI